MPGETLNSLVGRAGMKGLSSGADEIRVDLDNSGLQNLGK